MAFKSFTLHVDENTYKAIENISNKTGESKAEVSRKLLAKGLANELTDESSDMIANLVRQQIDVAIKPHVERLAALSSKSGHMSATAAFLNVQALMDLVPKENRKNVKEMYENARKKAAEYMRTKADDWEGLKNV